jgi:RNA-directed DNA polymerase
MVVKRQKKQVQLKLPFTVKGKGEALSFTGRVEVAMARNGTESPAGTEWLMEEVVEDKNLLEALKRVKQNRGGPGIDGMTVNDLARHMKKNWSDIRRQLLTGTYRPQPVKRVEIPKPNGGMRKLGIPTVTDRLIQQMQLQVLQKRLDLTFSEHSYGFRPGRSAHQAVVQAQKYIQEGRRWVVDIDLETFFDQVNHDKLMGLLAKRIKDKRMLRLVRAFLRTGVMENGLVSPTTEGTPQGGPLSPLLSNIVLDVLDRELEKRGHRFVRYADDCNIYVRSERAGDRVMKSITRFLEKKLKLKVNPLKSAVDRVSKRKFLGFSFTIGKQVKRRIAPQAIAQFKAKARYLTQRATGKSLDDTMGELTKYLKGWITYFGFCETPSVLRKLDNWLRRRLRSKLWKQWGTPKNRFKELYRRGVSKGEAAQTAMSPKGPWHISSCRAMHIALPTKFFDTIGLPRLASC